VALVEGDGAAEEAGNRCRPFVGEHFGVGEAAVVVDGDVHVLPADRSSDATVAVGDTRVGVLADTTTHALAGAALDPAQLLDVDVDELARP
jgi:hypothetical protein